MVLKFAVFWAWYRKPKKGVSEPTDWSCFDSKSPNVWLQSDSEGTFIFLTSWFSSLLIHLQHILSGFHASHFLSASLHDFDMNSSVSAVLNSVYKWHVFCCNSFFFFLISVLFQWMYLFDTFDQLDLFLYSMSKWPIWYIWSIWFVPIPFLSFWCIFCFHFTFLLK